MRQFSAKQNQPAKANPARPASSRSVIPERARTPEPDPSQTVALPSGFDFGRIAVHAPAPTRMPRRSLAPSPDTAAREADLASELADEGHKQPSSIQMKSLAISRPDDPDENEADDVARKVTAGHSAEIRGTGAAINRKARSAAEASPEFAAKLASSKGGGRSLDDTTRSDIESKMRADFGAVRIHTGSDAHEMNASVGAAAFTHNRDIYFGHGTYAPGSARGKQLLVHELVHTVQQKGVAGRIQRQVAAQSAWEHDKSASGKELYYNTQEEANIRKADIEHDGMWEQYVVESFVKGGKTYWRVHMKGTRTTANFVKLVRKAEKAYSSWTKEQMLNSLRRLGGYDNENFQGMYGTAAATDLAPVPEKDFTQADIDLLEQMLRHADGKAGETGIVKDISGQYLAMGHVMTGISGGLHRNKNYDPTLQKRFKQTDLGIILLPDLGAGANVDNLYATTLAGDFGQSNVLVNERKQLGYVGPGTEATDAEVTGDIDGLVIGEALSESGYLKKWSDAKALSDFIEQYYRSDYKNRFAKAAKLDQPYLQDQTQRFATNYAYRDSKMEGMFTEAGSVSKESFAQYASWLAKKKTGESKKPPPDFVISANYVQLVSDPTRYPGSITGKLMKGTEVRLVDEGTGKSFNKLSTQKWTKILVVSGDHKGESGWVSRTFLQDAVVKGKTIDSPNKGKARKLKKEEL
jgi:hypothetical protein